MNTRAPGPHGPQVSALGLGCLGMSDFYGPADEAESIAPIHAVPDIGITLLIQDVSQTAQKPAHTEQAVPLGAAAGNRCNAHVMQSLDSERSAATVGAR